MLLTKQRAHQTKHIREEGDNLCDNECDDPRGSKDSDPDNPCDHGVRVEVSRTSEDPKEDVACCYGL